MTSDTANVTDEMDEGDLEQVARRLLEAMPLKLPPRLDSPTECGWCTEPDTDQLAGVRGRRHRQEDPAAWTLHVLREHLRPRLADTHCGVVFNSAGGAIVHLFYALPEDVALFREALGLQLTGVKSRSEHECVVHFGNDPFQREVTMAWFTTPRLLCLTTNLLTLLGFVPEVPDS